ncbi:hypothetical protein B0H11DRAFT_2279542 [Mycena galericulata]|nr:hypothetical protein B0H11DRAFT_2279542 [Mycena galericulata]
MPTVIHSASAGRPHRTGGTPPELQKLILCLGVVAAFVFASFGIAKLMELRLPSRRRAEIAEPSSTDTPATHTISTPWKLHDAASRKPGPYYDLRTSPGAAIAVLYTKTAPCLRHISAPRAYALRHRRRAFRTHPGPSPLRNAIDLNSKTRAGAPHAGARHLKSRPPVDLNSNSARSATRRAALAAAARAVSSPGPGRPSPSSAPTPSRVPHSTCADDDSDDDDQPLGTLLAIALAQIAIAAPPSPSPASASASASCVRDSESLQRAAAAVVGAYPSPPPSPALDRLAPIPIQQQPLQPPFPWVSSSGVGGGGVGKVDFKFGLVCAAAVRVPAQPPSVVQAPPRAVLVTVKPRDANAHRGFKNQTADAVKDRENIFGARHGGRRDKENAAV